MRTFSRAFSVVLMVREIVGCETSKRWARASGVRLRGFSAGLTQVVGGGCDERGEVLGGEAGCTLVGQRFFWCGVRLFVEI